MEAYQSATVQRLDAMQTVAAGALAQDRGDPGHIEFTSIVASHAEHETSHNGRSHAMCSLCKLSLLARDAQERRSDPKCVAASSPSRRSRRHPDLHHQ